MTKYNICSGKRFFFKFKKFPWALFDIWRLGIYPTSLLFNTLIIWPFSGHVIMQSFAQKSNIGKYFGPRGKYFSIKSSFRQFTVTLYISLLRRAVYNNITFRLRSKKDCKCKKISFRLRPKEDYDAQRNVHFCLTLTAHVFCPTK